MTPSPSFSDIFTRTGRTKTGGGWKNTSADIIKWHGIFAGSVVILVSTVRLVGGNMEHFMVSSNARIGGRHVLQGGHFADLVVSSRHPLTQDELLA